MKAYIKFISAMLIFGSVGIFVKNISISSVEIVVCRTVIASLYLFLIMAFSKKKFNIFYLRKNIIPLFFSGLFLGLNWLFLFVAYKNTSVSMATVLYYLAPIIVVFMSPFVLKEKINFYKAFGIFLSLFGIILVKSKGAEDSQEILGIVSGLAAAFFYALLMIFNKFIKGLSSIETTLVQLLIATTILLPYAFYSHNGSWGMVQSDWIPILIVGIVHTGTACLLYFSAMKDISSQSIALISYIDPLSALCFSMIFLNEKLSLIQLIGAVFIFFGPLLGEGLFKLRRRAEGSRI